MTAKGIVEDYLKLCRNPAKDLKRWIAEDKTARGAPEAIYSLTKGGEHADTQGTAIVVAEADRLRRQPLPELRDGLDADGRGRQRVDDVPARSRAGAGEHDGVRQVRAEARTGDLRSTTTDDRGRASFAGAGFRAFAAAHEARGQKTETAARAAQPIAAFVALAHVVADVGGGGWPESMTRELQGCATPQERQAWAVKWGAYLSGQVERDKRGAPERPQAGRAAGGACQPS